MTILFHMRQNALALLSIAMLMLNQWGWCQDVTHIYRFVESLKATESCGPELKLAKTASCPTLISGGKFVNDRLRKCGAQRAVFVNNLNWGFCYSNLNQVIRDEYTIHLYLKVMNWGTRQWVRIIDFSNGKYDKGIYFKKAFAEERCLDFYPSGIVGPCPYFKKEVYYLLSFTRNRESKMINVYVNSELFLSFYDSNNKYCSTGEPIYIFRDDKAVPCESGQANFAYLSFSNTFSDDSMIQYTYNSICKLSEPQIIGLTLSKSEAEIGESIIATYLGNISGYDQHYRYSWTWDGGQVLSGENSGPFKIAWEKEGSKNITLTLENTTCKWKKALTKIVTIKPSRTVPQVPSPRMVLPNDPLVLLKPKEAASNKRVIEPIWDKDLSTFYVDTGKITLSFYDNGEVDGDTVTVLINNIPVLTKQRLSVKAINYEIEIERQTKPILIEIFAENEGTIPPNTCLLIIKSDKIYKQVFLSSILSKGKRIRLEHLE